MVILLDDFPLELLRLVCNNLKPNERSVFRLVRKKWAAIGLRTIPEVHFVLLPKSLERLQAISEHLFFRQHVCRLIYEGDRLPRYVDMKAWANDAEVTEPSSALVVPALVSRRMRRVYREKARQIQLAAGWQVYQELFAAQQAYNSSNIDFEIVRNAMARFPKLVDVRVHTASCFERPSPVCLKEYRACLVHPSQTYHSDWMEGLGGECGVRHLQSLLVGASAANAKITTLRAGGLSWQFFDPNVVQFDNMRHALQSVEEISLKVCRDIRDGGPDVQNATFQGVAGLETSESIKHLVKGQISKFLTLAPNLQVLALSFDNLYTYDDGYSGPHLSIILGTTNHHWPHLCVLDLSYVKTTAEYLLQFLRSHAHTLEILYLGDCTLRRGRWPDVIRSAALALNLSEARVRGRIMSVGPRETWWADDGGVGTPVELGEWLGLLLCRRTVTADGRVVEMGDEGDEGEEVEKEVEREVERVFGLERVWL